MVLTKSSQRRTAYDRRNTQQNKETLSQKICAAVLAHESYQKARTVLWYLHCRSEVQTLSSVVAELKNQDKQIVIPYCTKDPQGNHHLGLWSLGDLSELVPGTWGILEPPKARWGERGKEVSLELIDLVITPGVAFDRQGGRLGNGAGYYDRLFAQLDAHTRLMGVGFESQLVEQVLMHEHDVYLDGVITETTIYQGKGRLA